MYALPVGLAGLFLAGVLATAMSTIDSYSLVAGGPTSPTTSIALWLGEAADPIANSFA